MKFLQWNCRSLKAKWTELQKYINDYDVVLLSETWLMLEDSFVPHSFEVIRKDHLERGGGAAILIQSNIKYLEVDIIQHNCKGRLEVCVAKIWDDRGELTLISCYRAPGIGIDVTSWNCFFNQFKGRTLIGDFNAHHPL